MGVFVLKILIVPKEELLQSYLRTEIEFLKSSLKRVFRHLIDIIFIIKLSEIAVSRCQQTVATL